MTPWIELEAGCFTFPANAMLLMMWRISKYLRKMNVRFTVVTQEEMHTRLLSSELLSLVLLVPRLFLLTLLLKLELRETDS